MANESYSPNMNLVLPGVGNTAGPDWATDLNTSLGIIDLHNHASGNGVQITPSGLNINADLTFQGNNATSLRSVRLATQSSVLTQPADLGCFYNVSGDAYYTDGNGNKIRLTQSGGLAGTPGSISGLASPASATFVSGSSSFVWQSNANVAANLDAGSLLLRNLTVSSYALTLSPPNSMGANYALTLPALPGATSFMTMTAAGAMSGSIPTANGITRTNLAAVGQQVSGTCNAFTTSSTTPVAVTNLSVTITTSGRPVMLMLISDGVTAGNAGQIVLVGTPSTYAGGSVCFFRGASQIAEVSASKSISSSTDTVPCSSVQHFDVPSAGTYTYSVKAYAYNASGSIGVQYCKLLAYEL